MDKLEVLDIIERINRLYPRRQIAANTEIVEEWHRKLKDSTADQVNAYLDCHVENEVYPPTIADLLGNTTSTEKSRAWAGYTVE